MQRKHVPQLTGQVWFPKVLRLLIAEFLTWFVGKVGAARPFLPFIEEGLASADARRIVNLDLGLGAGT